MQRTLIRIAWMVLIMALVVPLLAQAPPPPAGPVPAPAPKWFLALSQAKTWIWMGIAALCSYLFSVVFTMLFGRFGYPPNMARLGCWLGSMAWLLVTTLVIFPVVLLTGPLPVIVLVSLYLIAVFIGIILLATKKHPTL